MSMRIDEFDFELPEAQIAQHPVAPRDASRLLVVDRASGTWCDRRFAELPGILRAGDLLVRNDARVVPARLRGTRSGGGSVEVLVLERVGGTDGDETWRCLARPGKRLRAGERARLAGPVEVEWLADAAADGVRLARFRASRPIAEMLETHGEMPLPPYLRRDVDPLDRERYQTTYASTRGAIAAPTAGLHFTAEVDRALEDRGVEILGLTLHVGLATFLPVRAETIEAHALPSEKVTIPAATAEAIGRARAERRRVVAVGTTTVRALEGRAEDGGVAPGAAETSLFIRPGHRFRVVDAMLTNFHLPRSTLLVLVCAFAGRRLILDAYEHAVRSDYRFYSYGDAMLVV